MTLVTLGYITNTFVSWSGVEASEGGARTEANGDWLAKGAT